MRAYTITANVNNQRYRSVQMKDGADTYQIDASPWTDDNTAISTATWTVKSGNVSISGKTLTSSVASALLTFSEAGWNLVQLKLDSGTEIYIVWLEILAKDPDKFLLDYGLCD